MNTFEKIGIGILAIPAVMMLIAMVVLIAGVLKKHFDPEDKSGGFGFIIAIIIAIALIILYALVGDDAPGIRHS